MSTEKIAKYIVSKYDFNQDEIEFLTPKMEDLLVQFVGVTLFSRLPDDLGEKIAQKVQANSDIVEIVEFLEDNLPNFQEEIRSIIEEFLDQF